MADTKEAVYQWLELQRSQNDSSAFDDNFSDSEEDDGYIDIMNSSHGERTSTAWVESKQHRELRQSVSDEIKQAMAQSAQTDSVINEESDEDDEMKWHDHEQDPYDEADEEDSSQDDSSLEADDAKAAGVGDDQASEMQFQVKTIYPGHYFGAAVFPDGDDRQIEQYSERAASVVLQQPTGLAESRKCKILVSNNHLKIRAISMKKGKPQVEVHLASLRCFSLHRDRHLKPKFVSVMALRSTAQRTQHPSKPYACYLFHFAKTADAASFMAVMKYVCKQQLKEKLKAAQTA